jgi:DNA-binding NarL/FixJ family response regulator/anti-sigma regulatory factor (Ser/Thr protein kinase)
MRPTEVAQGLVAEPGPAVPQPVTRDYESWPQFPADEDATFAVQAAVAAERARIAREMHDSTSKSLLGIAIAAASLCAPRHPGDPLWLEQRLRDLARLAQHAVSETRSVINNLRDDSLGEAVRCVATAWGLAAGASVSLAVAPAGDAPEGVRREIVAVLCELLHNVQQHARASRVAVSLRTVAQGLSLAVSDDGVGFCPPADLRELESAGHHGLPGIAERVRQIGGALIIRSRPGPGTHVAVHIPVRAGGRHQPPAVPPSAPVRVVIAEENPVLRSGLRAVLECAPDLEIVAEAHSGKETVEQVERHGPDVLVFDAGLQMADGSAVLPRISGLTRVVVLTCADDGSLAVRAADAGEHRYAALGEFEPSDLIQIVHDAARRSPYPAPPPMAAFPGRPNGVNGASLSHRGGELTPREREVMGLIAEGLSNRQIAARLVISEKTVKNHICSIYQRIGVDGRSEAVSRWRQL